MTQSFIQSPFPGHWGESRTQAKLLIPQKPGFGSEAATNSMETNQRRRSLAENSSSLKQERKQTATGREEGLAAGAIQLRPQCHNEASCAQHQRGFDSEWELAWHTGGTTTPAGWAVTRSARGLKETVGPGVYMELCGLWRDFTFLLWYLQEAFGRFKAEKWCKWPGERGKASLWGQCGWEVKVDRKNN